MGLGTTDDGVVLMIGLGTPNGGIRYYQWWG